MEEEKVFIKITNKDIYDRIVKMEKKSDSAHLVLRLHQAETNGKVKLNRWLATTALTLTLTFFGFFAKANFN